MTAIKSALKSSPAYEIIIGIDRSDKTISVAKYHRDGSIEEEEVNTRAWSLERWWRQIREHCPVGKIAVAFEQLARNLIAFFGPSINLKPNSICLQWLGAFITSGIDCSFRAILFSLLACRCWPF